MSMVMGGGFNNGANPFQGVLGGILERRRAYRQQAEAINHEHQLRVSEQAMAHQHATDRIYHQGSVDYSLQEQRHEHASALSRQESHQRRGEARNLERTFSKVGGGRPVSSMTVPGGSVTFSAEPKKTKKANKGSRQSGSAPQQSPAPRQPMSPQFSASGQTYDPQGGAQRPNAFEI